MSQSTTFYRLSASAFDRLKNTRPTPDFDYAVARDYVCLQGSFMGLEFVLAKGRGEAETGLLAELFSPSQTLGDADLDSLPPEELGMAYERMIHYLAPERITAINDLLSRISEADIHSQYDAAELNRNDIYPYVWHSDNTPDKAFNEHKLTEDLGLIQSLFQQARKENDYIVVFTG